MQDLERPSVDTSAVPSPIRPNGPPRSRSSQPGQHSADALTSPLRQSANTHPYAAITSSSGTLTRSSSVPASPSWVPSHRGSRSLSSIGQQQPRPLPTPPGYQPPSAAQLAPEVLVDRKHRRADSLPFTFPHSPSMTSSHQLAKLPRDPANWTHEQLLLWLEARLSEAGLAKPVVHDVLVWLGRSRPGDHGSGVGGLALNGKEFMKGEEGAWANVGQRPPFHTLLLQLSKSLESGYHPRQTSTVEEADEAGDETSVKRLVRGWEERSSSSASEAGSDDDEDDVAIYDGLRSPSACRTRESEKRYRRRSALNNAQVASLLPDSASGSSVVILSDNLADTPTLDSSSTFDSTTAENSTRQRRERGSYDGLGSSHEGPEGETREERRVMTVKPRKSSGPPSIRETHVRPVATDTQDAEDVVRLRALVITLSDRVRSLEARLDSLEQLADTDEKRQPKAAHTLNIRQLPGFLCLASLGLGILVWGVIARGRRGIRN